MAVNYNDGKWHGWNGGDNVPYNVSDKSIVEFVWHDEATNELECDTMQAGWNDIDERPAWSNILKFRVIKEQKAPREWWILHGKIYGYDCDPSAVHVREVIE